MFGDLVPSHEAGWINSRMPGNDFSVAERLDHVRMMVSQYCRDITTGKGITDGLAGPRECLLVTARAHLQIVRLKIIATKAK
jgi:hypothetical protein